MSFLVHSLLFEPQLSDGAVYLCWGFETVDSWDDGTATDKPLKKKSHLPMLGQFLTTEANFPANSSLVLGSVRGTCMDIVSGEADPWGKGGI